MNNTNFKSNWVSLQEELSECPSFNDHPVVCQSLSVSTNVQHTLLLSCVVMILESEFAQHASQMQIIMCQFSQGAEFISRASIYCILFIAQNIPVCILHRKQDWTLGVYIVQLHSAQSLALYSAQDNEKVYSAQSIEVYSAHFWHQLIFIQFPHHPPINYQSRSLFGIDDHYHHNHDDHDDHDDHCNHEDHDNHESLMIIVPLCYINLLRSSQSPWYMNDHIPSMPSCLQLGSYFPAKDNKFSRCQCIKEWCKFWWWKWWWLWWRRWW